MTWLDPRSLVLVQPPKRQSIPCIDLLTAIFTNDFPNLSAAAGPSSLMHAGGRAHSTSWIGSWPRLPPIQLRCHTTAATLMWAVVKVEQGDLHNAFVQPDFPQIEGMSLTNDHTIIHIDRVLADPTNYLCHCRQASPLVGGATSYLGGHISLPSSWEWDTLSVD